MKCSHILPLALLLAATAAATADPLAPASPPQAREVPWEGKAWVVLLPEGTVRWEWNSPGGFQGTGWREAADLAYQLRHVHHGRHERGEGLRLVWALDRYGPKGQYSALAKDGGPDVEANHGIIPVGSAVLALQHFSGEGPVETVRVVGYAADPTNSATPDRESRRRSFRDQERAPVDLLYFPDYGKGELRHLLAKLLSPHYRVRALSPLKIQPPPEDHSEVPSGRFAGPFGI